MKKSIFRLGIVLLLCALCAGALLACGTVKFELNFKVDGQTYATLTTAGEESISLPENPTKEGYLFDGWYWDEGTWQRPFTANSLLDAPLSGDMSVYAHFVSQAEKEQEEQEKEAEKNSYTVTFETNGGTTLPSQKVKVLNESPVTEKDYNSFVGWYTDASLQESTRVTFPYTPTSDVTLYAKWSVNFTEGLQMTLQVSTNTYAVTGYTGGEEVVVIPSTYKGLDVTAISARAFEGNSTITKAVIPNSVITVGLGAFSECYNLKTVEMSSQLQLLGANAFSNCIKLESVTLPDSLQNIGGEAFFGCTALRELYLSNQLVNIGTNIIRGCNALEKLTLPGRITLISLVGDTNDNIPASLTEICVADGSEVICANMLLNCAQIEALTIPATVASVGENVFSGCTALASVRYGGEIADWCEIDFANAASTPDSYRLYIKDTEATSVMFSQQTGVKPYVFNGCISLETVIIPEEIKSIGDGAFDGCTAIRQATIPTIAISYIPKNSLQTVVLNSGTNIPASAFSRCITLTSVTIPDSVTSIGASAFSGCTGLTSVTVPDSVTSIGSAAFSGCSSLTSLTIPFVGGSVSATSASESTLFGYIFGTTAYTGGAAKTQCYSSSSSAYTTYYIPSGLKKVTVTGGQLLYGAFSGYTDLTSVTIGSGVTSIGSNTFSGCTALASVNYAGTVAGWCGITGLGNLMASGRALFINGNRVTGELVIPDGVTSIAAAAFRYCNGLTSVTIPASVTSVASNAFTGCTSIQQATLPTTAIASIPQNSLQTMVINGGTSIPTSAFSGCTNLTSVTIPSGVTSIAGNAFSGCTATIIWGGTPTIQTIGAYAFAEYQGTALTIPASVTSIGNYAFSGCTGLTSVTIPDSVTSIGSYAFSGCTGLTSITIPSSVTSIGSSAFRGCTNLTSASIGNSVKSIGAYAFYGCTGLTSVTIPNSVTSIGERAFTGCKGLTSVIIPNSVTSIGEYAFYGCTGLTSVTIPNSVTSIGEYAFSGCTGLTSVTIGNGVTSIGQYAFQYCYKLVEVYNLSSLTITAGSSFNGYAGYYAKVVHTSPDEESALHTNSDGYVFCILGENAWLVDYTGTSTALTLPDNYDGKAYGINQYAFYERSDLTSIIISDGVMSIGNYAFSGCTGLTSVTIPSSVTNIGYEAFSGCTGLTSVSIGNSVMSIGNYAFKNCTKLTSVTIPNSVTIIGSAAFSGCSSLYSLTIPFVGGSASATEASSSTLFGYIFGISSYTGGTAAKQSNSSNTTTYYIPTRLRQVTVTGGRLLHGAFSSCTGLTSVTIGSGVAGIGPYAFSGCTGLTAVTFAEDSQLTGIGRYAFSDCTGLTSITIPNSVTSIGYKAFSWCSSLTSVTFENTSGWYMRYHPTDGTISTSRFSISVTNASTNATNLVSYYCGYDWYRNG